MNEKSTVGTNYGHQSPMAIESATIALSVASLISWCASQFDGEQLTCNERFDCLASPCNQCLAEANALRIARGK